MEKPVSYEELTKQTAPRAVMLETFDDHVNRNAKDSVFCDLFRRPEYCLQLYKVLHPEDQDVTAECITLVTLSNLMVHGRYNDLGILVRNRLLVLVEAQSVFTENILVRFLLYLADTYSRYIARNDLKIYGSKKVSLPVPELYVIYHGDRGDKPDEILLSKDIFGVEDPKNIFVDIKARIIYDSTPGDIINQFITFARVFDRCIREFDRTQKAVEETLRICRNENILREYLKEEGAATIMFSLADERKAMADWEEELRQESKAEGEAKLGKLMGLLLKSGKNEDALRVTSDPVYREKLYKDYMVQ